MKLKSKSLATGALFCLTALLLCIAPAVLAAPTVALPAQVPAIQSLEDTLFSVRYEQESPEQRIARLEETVFGQKQTGTLDNRLTKLKGVLSVNSLGALSPTAKNPVSQGAGKATQASTQSASKSVAGKPTVSSPATSAAQPIASASPTRSASPTQKTTANTAGSTGASAAKPAPGETDYPTVSQMEQKVFNQTYVQEDLTARLTRLEQEVFKLPQSGALADRVDNLRLVVLGDVGQGPPAVASYQPMSGTGSMPGSMQGQPSYSSSSYGGGQYGQGGYSPSQAPYGGGYPYPGSQVNSGGQQPYYGQPAPASYQSDAYSGGGDYQASYQPGMNPAGMANGQVSPDMLAAMNEIEKQVIGKTFPSEPVPARLDRLEGKVFHVTSPELPPQERMQRVIAVASAGGAPSSPQAKAKSTFQNLLPIILTILPLILL